MSEIQLWSLDAQSLSEVISTSELSAIEALKDLSDPRRDSRFWEKIVARILGGVTTDHQCPWDVEVDGIKVEVKFSTGFDVAFSKGRRRVFKFASLLGCGLDRKQCDVLVMIGFDNPDVFCWVVPYADVNSKVVTISHPATRAVRLGAHNLARFDRFGSSLTQLLPDVCRAYRDGVAHNAWDQPHRAVNASLTRKLKAGQPDLFPRANPNTPASGALKIEEADRGLR